MDFEKIIKKPQLNFKGKLPASEKSKEDQESSSDEEPEAEQEKPRRKRNDSIDMPLVENDNNNHENVQAEKEKSTETSSKDVNDDLEISDSDDSNSRPPDKSDAKKTPKEKKTEPPEIDDPDDYLLYLEDILKTVHKAYYDLYDQSKSDSAVPAPDLKTVIPYVKRKVLAGVVLVFSGVIPTQVAVERSKPFLLARSLGAVVRSSVDHETTHLVAARLGTAKVGIVIIIILK